jgi:beta-N-acetylhexosaminidase
MKPSAPFLSQAPFSLDAGSVEWVESSLAGLSIEQKVGQLFCVYLKSTDMDEWTGWLAERGIQPGGMMMISRPRNAARRDVTALQAWSPLPLLIAGNLESGAVNFLDDTEAFANPLQVAATNDVINAERLAIHCARAANEIGINWAFAPVVDIAVNPHNPIVNTRSFGRDPEVVATMGARYISTLEDRGIATSTKHFPGDGVDDRDQHLVTTSNDLDASTWRSTFGAVYRRAIAAGTRTIMVGHIRQRALSRELRPGVGDSEILPATLSADLVTGVLRGELGFNGLIVSDNTAMAGYTSVMPRESALPLSINSGLDMILGNVDLEVDYSILLAAASSGEIPPERLDDAVRRVLATKASIGLHRRIDRDDAEQPMVREENGWRNQLAETSVTLVKDTQKLLPLSAGQHRRALVVVLGDEPTFYDPSGPFAPQFIDGLRERGLDVDVRTVPGPPTTAAEADRLHERYDLCIYFANVRFVGNSNSLRLTWTPWQGFDAPRHVATLPTVLVSIADPYLLQDVPMIKTALNGYTPTPATVAAVVRVLFGEIPAVGVSPMDPFAGHWDAAL